jgi:hypothetical protein
LGAAVMSVLPITKMALLFEQVGWG